MSAPSQFFQGLPAWFRAEPSLSEFSLEEQDGALVLRRGAEVLVLRESVSGLRDEERETTLFLDPSYHQGGSDIEGTARLCEHLPSPLPLPRLREAIVRAFSQHEDARRAREADKTLARAKADRDELLAISAALSEEHEIERLLSMILQRLRGITYADAGSLYLVEPPNAAPTDRRMLRFSLVQNDSKPVDFSERLMPLDHSSLAGYVASTGQPLNLARADAPPADLPVRHAARFDAETGYPARSLLTVPMTTPAGKVLGVVQLINRKRERDTRIHAKNVDQEVIPFDAGDQELARSLASQAAVALENALLHREIKGLFEGLVRASVTAIEARDPTTSGHSQRVSLLSVALAQRINHVGTGPYAGVSFDDQSLKEIEYAALLHDFGKVGVREEVLVKSKKLFPWQEKLLRARFALAKKSYEAQLLQQRLSRVRAGQSLQDALGDLEPELERVRGQLSELLRMLLMANEPVPPEGAGNYDLSSVVMQARSTLYPNEDGVEEPLLTADEVIALSIPRGSLTAEERREIESHVEHTFKFLIQIPWTRDLRRIPEIAGAHHERVDGRGYPKQRAATEILPQARILAVADVFDALTAKDRPYKKAIPLTPALDIITGMARGGHLDPDLVKLFIESRAYDVVKVSDNLSAASLLAVKAVTKPK
jgi:HD-GYP domain-containing protein (c-di-GMP phosphodiesterase class II)